MITPLFAGLGPRIGTTGVWQHGLGSHYSTAALLGTLQPLENFRCSRLAISHQALGWC